MAPYIHQSPPSHLEPHTWPGPVLLPRTAFPKGPPNGTKVHAELGLCLSQQQDHDIGYGPPQHLNREMSGNCSFQGLDQERQLVIYSLKHPDICVPGTVPRAADSKA